MTDEAIDKRGPLLLGLFAAAMALRIPLAGLPPLLPEIRSDLDMDHASAGILLTIPVLCMGAFALGAAPLVSRFSNRSAIMMCLVGVSGFGLVRAMAPSAFGVLIVTVAIGIAMGLGGGLLPIVVKHSFRRLPALASGVYASGIQLGAAIAAVMAVPLSDWLRGWRGSLIAQSGLILTLALIWMGLSRTAASGERSAERRGVVLHAPVVWLITAIFALQAFSYHGLSSWLPEIYVERGWSEREGGALLGALNLASIVVTLAASWLMDRWGSRRLYLISSIGVLGFALLGILYQPSLGWLWAILSGMSLGLLFVASLVLPLDVVDNPRDAGAVAGFMLAAGYMGAALAPFVLGWLRDVTGNFDGSVIAMVMTIPLLLVASWALSPRILSSGLSAKAAPRNSSPS